MPSHPCSVVTDQGRECLTCGEFKPWSEYGNATHGTNNRKSHCIPCAKLKNKLYMQRRRAGIAAERSTPKESNLYRVTHDPTGTRVWLNGNHGMLKMEKTLEVGHFPEGMEFTYRLDGRRFIVVGEECHRQRLEEIK